MKDWWHFWSGNNGNGYTLVNGIGSQYTYGMNVGGSWKLMALRFYLSYIVYMHGDYAMVQVDVDHAIGNNMIHGLLDHIFDMWYGQVGMEGMMWVACLKSNRCNFQYMV